MNRHVPGSILCGVVCVGIAIVILMQLGIKWHGNYEYYGRYLIPGVIGFFLPPIVRWCVKCKRQ